MVHILAYFKSFFYVHIFFIIHCKTAAFNTYTMLHALFSLFIAHRCILPKQAMKPRDDPYKAVAFFPFASYIFLSKEFNKTAVWPQCSHESKSLKEVNSKEGSC